MPHPFAVSLPYGDPAPYFAAFSDQPYAQFLDSAQFDERQGRYSYFCAKPIATFTESQTIWQDLETALARFDPITPDPQLPPFQGGLMGYWGYELLHTLEHVSEQPRDDMDIPDVSLGLYDWVAAFDHMTQKAWVISLVSLDHAQDIQHLILAGLESPRPKPQPLPKLSWQSDFSAQAYQETVQRVIDYIMAGDIFQANLTQRFKADLPPLFNAYDFYTTLRHHNPAFFAAYLNFPTHAIASSSPERFIQLQDGKIETRPIKGTRPRHHDRTKDHAAAQALKASLKDKAENTMIVDLLRNDISRISTLDSVEVEELCALYSFASVHHLISTITATLAPNFSAIDVLKATFPGGSITGAPKIRAMEIISQLERCRRTAYCGAIGYLGIGNRMDTNIVIRTALFTNNKAAVQVGGGIVADSDPLLEYEETLDKAQALFHAFDLVGRDQ